MIGPWIEQVGSDQLRISPLLQNAGQETMAPASQRLVHLTAAQALTGVRSIDIDKADAAFVHALLGKAASDLMKLAYGVIKATPRKRKLLSEWVPALRSQKTDQSIYPEEPRLAILLRFAKLLLVSAAGKASAINKCWQAVLKAFEGEGDASVRSHFEYLIVTKVLFDQDTAGLLDDWVNLIFRFERTPIQNAKNYYGCRVEMCRGGIR